MIIHSPVISGSLIFAEGATFTLPDGGVYSGSFSGSFQGDGSSLTFSGTNIISSSTQLASDFLDTLGDGVISGSSQVEFNDVNNTPFSQSATSVTVSKDIVPTSATVDLGSPTNRFRDIYVSNNSINFSDGTFGAGPSGYFQLLDANEDPAKLEIEAIQISRRDGTSITAIASNASTAGVSFLDIEDTQTLTYNIDNYDLQESVTFNYTDSSGNPQSVTVPANTPGYALDAQYGSIVKSTGTDKYRIRINSYGVPKYTPIEVASLILTGSNGSTPITPGESGSVILPKILLSGSDGTSPITPGESGSVIVPQITVSGSNGTSTITNDLPGDGPAVVDENGEVTPIKVKQVNLVDSVTGDVVQLSVLSGSLITTATDSTGSAIVNPKSNLSGSFTGSLTLTSDITTDSGDCVKIGTVANPICEIHGTDIFGAINATNGVVSGSIQVEFNEVSNNPFSQSASSVTVSKSIVPSNDSIDLGSSGSPFRDLYLSSASLYIDGQQVISSNTNELIITTDANQSLKLVETGADTITLQSANGDITLVATGNGTIELNAPIQIVAGNQIISSDGNAIQIGEDISVSGNITVTGTVDGVDVAALKGNVDAILASSTADKDSFAEIVSLINSVDTTNDNAFASFYTASNDRFDSIESFTSSIDSTIKTKLNTESVISGSSQITELGSLTIGGDLVPSTHESYDLGSPTLRWRDLYLSGSTIDLGGTQIKRDSITGNLGFFDGGTGTPVSADVDFNTIVNKPTLVSGSSQIDITATTGYSAISSHIADTSNPHSVTAAQVGLGNVTNESKETMFSSPTFTGTVSGVTATHVGLGNVTNESKTTMFSSPTFTGTVSGVTKAHVGLGNVDNESKATMFTNAALTGNPTAPTQIGTDDSTKIATTAFVQGRIDDIIGNAGAALDTLGELSASLAQDSGSLASLVTTVGGKLTKSSNLSDLTDVAQARTNLGVDAAGTDNSTDVTLAGSYDYLTISGQVITRNQIDASTDISNLNTTNVSEGSNLYYTDTRVKAKLTAEGVISSSAQITITESQILDLDHYTDSDFDARLATKTTTNLSEGTNLYYTDARVKTKLTAEDVVSGSASQVRTFLNVENGATADQTGAEIKSLYEGEANTNAFTDALLSKLNGIEAGATADQSAEEIQDIVGAMVSTNTESGITVTYDDTAGKLNFAVATQSDENFTAALLSKLNGIEASADVTDATNVDAAGAVMNSDTSTAAMSFVIDEDTMASNTATKVPTQQSVKTYVDNKVAGLIDSAPGALDTLNELAAALGDDANFSSTVTTSIATKANSSVTISAGNGLSGGGDLTANRTLSMSGTYTGDFAVTGNITATADIVAYASSDERLKKNIELISDPIGKIKQLKGVTWVWKDEASDVAKQSPNVGVIAQDVEKVLPQVVKDRENGYKGVDYGKMVGLLIEAIKDQQKQIDELRSRLK